MHAEPTLLLALDPALVGAAITVATMRIGVYGLPAALGAATACFVIRMLGVRFGLNAPGPPGTGHDSGSPEPDPPASEPTDRQ